MIMMIILNFWVYFKFFQQKSFPSTIDLKFILYHRE